MSKVLPKVIHQQPYIKVTPEKSSPPSPPKGGLLFTKVYHTFRAALQLGIYMADQPTYLLGLSTGIINTLGNYSLEGKLGKISSDDEAEDFGSISYSKDSKYPFAGFFSQLFIWGENIGVTALILNLDQLSESKTNNYEFLYSPANQSIGETQLTSLILPLLKKGFIFYEGFNIGDELANRFISWISPPK